MTLATIEQRRRLVTANIKEALDAIQRADATGIKVMAAGGVAATGEWAVLEQDQVVVYNTVARGAATSALLLEDVLAVQTLWIDAEPPFVATSRFDAAFDQAFVRAVERVMGRRVVTDAIVSQPSLVKDLADPSTLDAGSRNAVYKDVRGLLGLELRVMPASSAASVVIDDLVVRSKEAARLVGILPEGRMNALHQANDGVATIAQLAADEPTVATALAIEWLRVEAKRDLAPYPLRRSLEQFVEGNVSRTFKPT